MNPTAKLIGAAAVSDGSVGVLATVRSTPVDVADGALLVASLLTFARVAIRLASEPSAGRDGDR